MRNTLPRAITLGLLSTCILVGNGNLIRPRESSADTALQPSYPPDLAPRAGGGGRGNRNGHPDGDNSHQSPDGGGGAGEQTGDEGGFSNTNEGETEGGFTNTCDKKRSWPGTLFWRRSGCANNPPTGEPAGAPEQGTPEPGDWDNLEIPEKFQAPGREIIRALDNVRTQPPAPKDLPSPATIESRYNIIRQPGTKGGNVPILRMANNFADSSDWYSIDVYNKLDVVDRYYNMKVEEVNQNPNMRADNRESAVDLFDDLRRELIRTPMLTTYSSINKKSIVLNWSYNKKYDLYRNYENDPEGYWELERMGLEPQNSVKFTDQVMYGWKKASEEAGKDPKDVDLENVVRQAIDNKETEQVITAALQRSGKSLRDENDLAEFQKGEEGFEAIMGTVHGKRVAQMLLDYHEEIGPRTISKVTVIQPDTNFDMVISIERQVFANYGPV
ncbi:uncharacterized protein EI97DRAFT_478838 [Westerdykella ornata]|uniref:Uncharacterized protein n=1 Tax=Westerdykella ornata TaxID=318751 RepID=A0A6A6JDV2_WESOR|nr:uncharacterized protein EI97DRAFT_478838 [Westerdykella ornata]KAF2274414.1 hypothetical protein EI97DRAFT_478838 [Westerdykella ornata]